MTDSTISISDVVDSAGFAEILGIQRRTVLNYLDRERQAGFPKEGNPSSFPKPLRYFGVSPVWSRQAAETYAANRPGPGWHEKGDERIAQYLRANSSTDTDRPADEGAEADQPQVQPT